MTCETVDIYAEDPTCAMTAEDHLESISDLLPQGRAWPRDPNSTLMRFWRAFAEVVKFAEDKVCELGEQFYCSTAIESIEIWAEQYGVDLPSDIDINPACLIAGADSTDEIIAKICAKVASTGGNSADDMIAAALALGFVVDVIDTSSSPVAVAGCWELGIAALGPPGRIRTDACISHTSIPTGFWSGRAVEHPEPELWTRETSFRSSTCGAIPGSSLGHAPLGPDCCNAAGYYDYETTSTGSGGACGSGEVTGPFLSDYPPPGGAESTLHCEPEPSVFETYTGHAYHFEVEVDLPATIVLQQSLSSVERLYPNAGCMAVGNLCSPLRSVDLDPLRELIEDMKPAHTGVYYDLIYI